MLKDLQSYLKDKNAGYTHTHSFHEHNAMGLAQLMMKDLSLCLQGQWLPWEECISSASTTRLKQLSFGNAGG